MDPILQGRGKAKTKNLFAISKDGEVNIINHVAISLTHRMTVEEDNKGHVENALNVSYMFLTPEGVNKWSSRVKNPDFLAQATSILKKEDHIVAACNSGGRGLHACVDLLNAVRFEMLELICKVD
uniref:Rhodanese domain-containing protein n=1 Tax=Cucumis melo TaxID=3656 RepID=A0A9I9EFJ3_CUCME